MFQDCTSSRIPADKEANALANARLIAAAPEMLATLKLVRDSGMRNAAWDAACAAITKAEGGAA
jgi:hypothetical protein